MLCYTLLYSTLLCSARIETFELDEGFQLYHPSSDGFCFPGRRFGDRPPSLGLLRRCHPEGSPATLVGLTHCEMNSCHATANLRTKILDFRGLTQAES